MFVIGFLYFDLVIDQYVCDLWLCDCDLKWISLFVVDLLNGYSDMDHFVIDFEIVIST